MPSDIGCEDLFAAVARARVGPEPEGVPFPQADSFARVIDLLTQLRGAGGVLTQDYITSNYAFDLRQTRYYTDAASYLGLVVRRGRGQGTTYALTPLGDRIMSLAPRARNRALVECLLARRVFHDTLKIYLEAGERPAAGQVEEFIRRARPELSDDTVKRRAGTVLSWAGWVMGLTA